MPIHPKSEFDPTGDFEARFVGHPDARITDETLPEGAEVDHAASLRANLQELARNAKSAVTPNAIAWSIRHLEGKGNLLKGVNRVVGAITLPFAVAVDGLELAVFPMFAVKDTVDIAVHGLHTLFHKKEA